MKTELTASMLHSFVELFLLTNYDDPTPIPAIHDEWWEMCLLRDRWVALAAPRGHAKSTTVTFAYVLFMVMFRQAQYVLIISDTEDQAIQFLGTIRDEIANNVELQELFDIEEITKDNQKEIIVQFRDKKRFRIRALGEGQRVRGRKAGHARPDLVVVDDLENDEAVESEERRAKLKRWFNNAVIPSMNKRRGKIRVVGTILHMDSWLMGLMGTKGWTTKLYKAHEAYNDFSNLLWPEYHTEESLREIRDMLAAQGEPESYSQEYLNDPTDQSEAFFRRDDFIGKHPDEDRLHGEYLAAVDFAISDQDKRAYTAIVVGKLNEKGHLHVPYVLRFRGDAHEIIEAIFQMQTRFDVQLWGFEGGQIFKTMESTLDREMNRRQVYLSYEVLTPTKDKRTRARPLQQRMRAGAISWDQEAEWYPSLQEELTHFPKGHYKDQVDAAAWLCQIAAKIGETESRAELEEEERDEIISFYIGGEGRNMYTGY